MSAPADSDLVNTAIRFGWYVAEVRGRNRPNGPCPSGAATPGQGKNQLPLRMERNATERRIEAQTVMSALAKKLALAATGDGTSTEATCTAIDGSCESLWQARHDHNTELALQNWLTLEGQLFEFDLGVQDILAATSDTQACGYQLGRGLAEVYWQLDIEPPPQPPEASAELTWNSWTFLLGEARCTELTRLVGRLSAYFSNYTAAGVAGSLSAWKMVAADSNWRTVQGPHAQQNYVRDDCLYRQIRRWYELIVLDQNPSTLIRPYAILRNLRGVWNGIRGFWLQIVGALLTLAAIAVFFVFLGDNQKSSFETSVFGILSVIGISVTTVSTRLKNTAQSLIARIQGDAYGDLVGLQITTAPYPPPAFGSAWQNSDRRRDRIIKSAVQSRRITSVNRQPD
jgi:hypothetical protein